MKHTSHHETALEDILAAADPSVAFAESRLAECETCQERLGDLLDVEASLSAAGDDVRRTLARAAPSSDLPGEAAVDEVLGTRLRAIAAERARGRRLRRVGGLLAVAAAVTAAVLVGHGRKEGPAPNRGVILGGARYVAVSPVGQAPTFDELRWKAEVPPMGWCVVRVMDAARSLIAESPPIRDADHWRPIAPPADRWPDHIRWEVRVYDGSGEHLKTISAEAWLPDR